MIHVTVTRMLNGKISTADVAFNHEEKTTTCESSFPLALAEKVGSALSGSRDVPGASV